jgi:hypothetical protein
VSSNGERKPPRPHLEVLGAPDPVEAAAITAALEQFFADTVPPPRAPTGVNPWQRAALFEGIGAKQGFASPWGEPRTWGSRYSTRPGAGR